MNVRWYARIAVNASVVELYFQHLDVVIVSD